MNIYFDKSTVGFCLRSLVPSQVSGELPVLSHALRYLCKGPICSLVFSLLDVKPSNVLINKEGHVKMCDFGISGYLVDSVAKTMDAGCKPYMAVSVLVGSRPASAQRLSQKSVWIHLCPEIETITECSGLPDPAGSSEEGITLPVSPPVCVNPAAGSSFATFPSQKGKSLAGGGCGGWTGCSSWLENAEAFLGRIISFHALKSV